MSLVHPLVTIEQTGVVQTSKEAPKQATIGNAQTLVEMFADETGEVTKVKQLQAMAGELTCEEFADAVRKAKEIADSIDKLNGFQPKADAKGAAKYGPKRALLGPRLSEAKALFGVAKQAPDVLKEKGYWPALAAARGWLADNAKTWDGNKAETTAEKQARKTNAAQSAAMTQVMLKNPQQEGETRADYLTRIDKMLAEAQAAAVAEQGQKRVQTIVEAIKKQFGGEMDALLEACTILLTENTKQEAPTE